MAEKNKVELFCIGTELTRLSTEKSDYWKNLIQEVRSIYSGKITYAANWYNEFEKITFWEDLDFIGIQAYFPLVKNENPTVQQISKGWKKHLSDITSVHQKYNRKILFTEMGYKSTPDSAIEPRQWIDYSEVQDKTISTETQANCYEAFFNTFWKKDWFAGVHIWQMRSDFVKGRGKSDLDFTPQGKPAESIIAKEFE
ncbi:MAG: exo-beta-1,3-glucanase (GH17 family) [Patescibacteria group bacterium]|jgi:exo-beta-1,3-glucanase (GH17 family)